ncbi:MAG: fructosamine kinase family protein [Chitinophagales bacterium]|nr:fructosamine kinase family protein [Chitinophagales bacterium]
MALVWQTICERILTQKLAENVFIKSFFPVSGGCINQCYVVTTSYGKFFLKLNSGAYPKMFETEKKGLELLNHAVTGIAPDSIGIDEKNDQIQLLVLECIETAKPAYDFWDDFAKKLSVIHQSTGEFFGLDHNNYIGSLLQNNDPLPDWNSFFITRRIEPQLRMAIDQKSIEKDATPYFERLYPRLSEIFPIEKPSLIHGDLWSGNFMTGKDGYVKLIDPAVYFGHRETDLAMSKLFGGFSNKFYESYQQYAPLEQGFEKRKDVYNLYPLLVHVNLFGGNYSQQVMSIIKKF